MLCADCGGVVGYEVMKTGESPKMVFAWVLKHYQYAPTHIIYDNACNLAKYCLDREPVFFGHTVFVVDRFHRKSHHNCAPSYDADLYDGLSEINTQVVEQFWASLKLDKNMLAFMNKVNFAVVIRAGMYCALRKREVLPYNKAMHGLPTNKRDRAELRRGALRKRAKQL